jgi:soluble lytic murein transglycosylase
MLEATERELERLQKISHLPLAAGYSDWLLGKARAKAHIEHAEGAHMLERSVVAHVEDADTLRLDAARLFMRAGQEQNSLRILDVVMRSKSARAREARGLSARAHGIMGNHATALRIYDSMLGKEKPKGKEDLAYEQAVMALLAGQPARALLAFDVLAQSEARESLRARTAELAAVAALEANRKDDAISRFRAVTTQYPFTLGAWLAADRLKQLGVEPPLSPIPESAPAAPRALSVEIPALVATLHEMGLDEWASKVLADQEPSLRTRYGASAGEVLCDSYELLGVAERRYAWSREAVGNLVLTKLPDTPSRWRWDCRFPRPYGAVTSELDPQWQLPVGLLYAVMRQESSFRTKVQSPVGAVGLMQVMPNTARRIIKEFGALPTCDGDDTLALDEPRCNLELGARYLHKLMKLFDGQLPLVVLAYNAGPDVVSHWLSEKKPMALDLFLAKIPYAETRNYVHHVLTNFLVYCWLSQPKPSLLALEWKPSVSKLDPTELY